MLKKTLIIIKNILITAVIAVFLFFIVRNFMPYERHYFYDIGFKTYEPTEFWVSENYFAYRDVINNFGEPNKKNVDENGWVTLYYDGMEITCCGEKELAPLANIYIYSPQYRFGLYSIGVGSPKKLVDFAYKWSNAGKSSDVGVYAYVDSNVWVEFEFDENDRVKAMMLLSYNI